MTGKSAKRRMNITVRDIDRDIVSGMDFRARKQGISRQQLLHYLLTREFVDDMQIVQDAMFRLRDSG